MGEKKHTAAKLFFPLEGRKSLFGAEPSATSNPDVFGPTIIGLYF